MAQKSIDSKVYTAMLAVLVVALVVIAVGVSNAYYVQTVKGLVRNTTTRNVTEISQARAQYLDEKLHTNLECVEMLADCMDADTTPENARSQAREFLKRHDALAIWIKAPDGRTFCTDDAAEAAIGERYPDLFVPALQGVAGSSEIFDSATNDRRMLFFSPIEEDDRTIGAIYASFSVEDLQAATIPGAYSDEGFNCVVNTEGEIVLSANRFAFLKEYDDFMSLLERSGNDRAAIEGMFADVQKDVSGNAVFTLQGEDQYVCYSPLGAKDGWSFVTVLPLDVAEEDGSRIVMLMVQMVGLLLGAIMLAVVAVGAMAVYRIRQKRANERHIQDIYQAIGENVDTAIFIVDKNRHEVEAAFENTKDILGIESDAFLKPFCPIGDEMFDNVSRIIHSDWTEGEGAWEFECFNPALARTMWVRITGRPVTIKGSQKMIYSLTDTTREHDAHERLMKAAAAAEHANRSKSSFLANLSHDIRTPMNAIVGFSELLERDADDAELVRDHAKKIEGASHHLLGLINDVLDISKIESGKATLNRAAFDLENTMLQVEAMMRPQMQAKRQTFAVELSGIPERAVVSDEGRLSQILVNLLSNATKYTPVGGDIRLSLACNERREGRYLHAIVTVADNGVGMSPEYLAHLFEAFSREEKASTAHAQGTGLGMTITKSLVDIMGGTIAVESREGAGTTFTVELDFRLSDKRADSPGEVPGDIASDDVFRGLKILIAEDDEINAEIITALLEDRGAVCRVVANGGEAVDAMRDGAAGDVDLVFMDVQMPVMDGYEATRAIRALDAEWAAAIPIVAMTADAFAEDVRRALDAGMDAHVAKPINMAQLTSIVAKMRRR